MASALVTLPDEILTQIIRYIEFNKVKRHDRHYRRTICALTRTNRRLSNIARIELYRHVVFHIDEAHLTPWQPEPSFVRKFLRTCRKGPDLLNSIRHMDIRWSLEIEEDNLLESLLRQLSKSTSLTHLFLDIPDIDFELTVDSCAIRLLMQHNQSFPHLQVLELISCDNYPVIMPPEMLFSLASLPSLQALHVRCTISKPEDETFSTSPQNTAFGQALNLKDQSFGLETLEIVKSIHDDALALMLLRCPKLKQLTALPGGLVEDEATGLFSLDSDDDSTIGQLSPRKLTTSLFPVHRTLKSLKLSGKAGRAALPHHSDHLISDNSIIHLSGFQFLTHLDISVELLSQDNAKTLDPDILRTMFPASLEYLEIHVEYSRGIFWAATGPSFFAHTDSSYFRTTPKPKADFTRLFTETLIHDSNRVRADLHWYLSLLSARKQSLSLPLSRGIFENGIDTQPNSVLPNLESLRIVELSDRSHTWDSLDFVKSGYCPDVFWELGVDFEVVLRVPKGWEVPKGNIDYHRVYLACMVYRYQPDDGSGTGNIRTMADGFCHPNGIWFSPDKKIIYVTDMDLDFGTGLTDDTKVSAVYAFTILICPSASRPFLTFRRFFAIVDTGVPNGIKCDTFGDVYSGCGDGVNNWNPSGVLIGRILVEGGIANFCFGRDGEMVLLGEERVWRFRFGGEVDRGEGIIWSLIREGYGQVGWSGIEWDGTGGIYSTEIRGYF